MCVHVVILTASLCCRYTFVMPAPRASGEFSLNLWGVDQHHFVRAFVWLCGYLGGSLRRVCCTIASHCCHHAQPYDFSLSINYAYAPQ